ncbi:MAG TPA: hypothetical protein IAC41_09475 [Candidatus Merdenecus merdavium]|nr:hypothetical protein [Candidatus Merdenecus merdavium]
MLNHILFILFLVSYLAMIIMLIKGMNPTLVLIGIGILWAVIGGIGPVGILNDIVGARITANASALMTILFGSWFAQVLVQTGVVKTIIRSAVELGGDKPNVVVVLIMIVVSLMFTSLFSIGPVIAVGVIVLPVMISLGVKPRIAVVAYGLSVGVATLVNVSQYAVVRGIISAFVDDIPENFGAPWTPYCFIAFGVGVLINIVGVLLTMHFTDSKKRVKSWAEDLDDDDDEIEFVPWYVCIATFIPVILVIVFKMNIFPAFILSGLYAILTTKIKYKNLRPFPLLSKTFQQGFTESSGMVMYMICTYILVDGAAAVRPIIEESIGSILPRSTFGLAVMIAIAVPLFMYRGPIAIGGAGAALYATIASIGAIPLQFLWMLCMVASGIHYGLDPTNSSNIWTCSYAKVKPLEFIKTVLPISWVYGAAIIGILFIMHG